MKLCMKKSVSTHVIQLLRTTFNIISIILLINKIFSVGFNSKLAFNIYDPYQTNSEDHHIKYQQIIIQGLDNNHLKQKVIKILKIDNQNKSKISKKKLKSWLCKLKLTGFFKSINIRYDKNHGHQVIYISLIPHAILRDIRILNLHAKLIPIYYIQPVISKHLGLPVNMIDLEESLQLIKLWYSDRGYLGININVKYKIEEQGVDIEIDEHLVNRIRIIVIPSNQTLLKFQQITLNNWLKKLLYISLDEPINTRNLEKKLRELQNKKLIQQGYYKIQNTSVRELFIYIHPVNERPTYLFGKKNLITQNFIEVIETLYSHTLSSFIFHKDFSIWTISKLYQYYSQSIGYRSINNGIYIRMSQYDFILLPLFIRTSSFSISSLANNWHVYDSLLTLHDNLALKHFVYYFDKYNSNILINITSPNLGPLIDFQYNLPFFYIMENWTSSLSLHVSNNANQYKKYDKHITNNYHDKLLIYPKSSLTHQYNLSFSINHSVYDTINIYNDLLVKQLNNTSLVFKNYIRFQRLKYSIHNSHVFTSFMRQTLDNFSTFIKHKFVLTINLNGKKSLLLGLDQYNIEVVSLIPNHNIKHYSALSIHRITHSLRKQMLIRCHYLNLSFKHISWLGQTQYLPVSEKSYSIGPDVIRGYTQDKYFPPYQLNNFKVEYYIPQPGERIIYIFLDYLINPQLININSNNIIRLNCISRQINPLVKMSYGLGIQITTPIKQIPPLKLEYGYNITNGQCLHLRVENVN
uniref:POTRA domain-containing protein n=1 Tax=Liagora brachyclada TaxID=1884665 RepID=A0A1G4NZU0_9FLOR|nr:Hypothetical protein ORF_4 [Liagora brachyclada]SCW24188.1 Hypothetical protein ORF_4 [Liagora brachyclada]